ncbi:MAG: hypothetical protein V1729_07035 [Candidatus Woesearchaeota archaeon]
MKKKGERTKAFFIHGLFIVMISLGLYFVITNSVSLTGHAVLDAETAKAKLQTALESSALFSQVTQSSMCIVINDPEQPLSLQAVKSNSGWDIAEMVDYCSGLTMEDIVVQFPDYDSFTKIVDNPSPRAISEGAMNRDFEILESKIVELGGNVKCDSIFKMKYCNALNTMSTPEQLIDGDMSCCIDDLTSSQKKLLASHIAEGGFEDETGVFSESPAGMLGLSMSMIIIIAVVLVVVVFGCAAAVLMKGGSKRPDMPGTPPVTVPGEAGVAAMPGAISAGGENPEITELKNYVQQVLTQGYTWDQVRTHLLEIGWDDKTADMVIIDAQQKLAIAQQVRVPPPQSASRQQQMPPGQ